jgi:hypothetical protein
VDKLSPLRIRVLVVNVKGFYAYFCINMMYEVDRRYIRTYV